MYETAKPHEPPPSSHCCPPHPPPPISVVPPPKLRRTHASSPSTITQAPPLHHQPIPANHYQIFFAVPPPYPAMPHLLRSSAAISLLTKALQGFGAITTTYVLNAWKLRRRAAFQIHQQICAHPNPSHFDHVPRLLHIKSIKNSWSPRLRRTSFTSSCSAY